jgi:hypothetical protein
MLNKIEKICMAHQYLIKMNTAKTALKWDENLKSSIQNFVLIRNPRCPSPSDDAFKICSLPL